MIYGEMTTIYTDQVANDRHVLSNAELSELHDDHNVNLLESDVESKWDIDAGEPEASYVEAWDEI